MSWRSSGRLRTFDVTRNVIHMNMHTPMTGAERARKWRAAMRAKGLKPRTFWLPDTSTPEFKEQARRDTEALNRWYETHADELKEVMSIQYWPPDEEE